MQLQCRLSFLIYSYMFSTCNSGMYFECRKLYFWISLILYLQLIYWIVLYVTYICALRCYIISYIMTEQNIVVSNKCDKNCFKCCYFSVTWEWTVMGILPVRRTEPVTSLSKHAKHVLYFYFLSSFVRLIFIYLLIAEIWEPSRGTGQKFANNNCQTILTGVGGQICLRSLWQP